MNYTQVFGWRESSGGRSFCVDVCECVGRAHKVDACRPRSWRRTCSCITCWLVTFCPAGSRFNLLYRTDVGREILCRYDAVSSRNLAIFASPIPIASFFFSLFPLDVGQPIDRLVRRRQPAHPYSSRLLGPATETIHLHNIGPAPGLISRPALGRR